MNASRRALTFDSLDRVMPDVDRLLAGHTTVGTWTLGQICNHLTTTLTWTVDGYPKLAPWFVRKTIGPLVLSPFSERAASPRESSCPAVPARAGPRRVRRGGSPSSRTLAFRRPLRPAQRSPDGRPDPAADWERFHCIHCARHLSFALPGK